MDSFIFPRPLHSRVKTSFSLLGGGGVGGGMVRVNRELFQIKLSFSTYLNIEGIPYLKPT